MNKPVFECIHTVIENMNVLFVRGELYHPEIQEDGSYLIKGRGMGERSLILEDLDTNFRVKGWICEQHSIGFITKCPTCLSLEAKPKTSKKLDKKMRQLFKKHKR